MYSITSLIPTQTDCQNPKYNQLKIICRDNNITAVYNGYSDIMDIVILLSLSIFPHLHIRNTNFIGYSDIMVIVIIWS